MRFKPPKLGAIYFALFLVLILGGVALKRVWGLPEYMMLFHLPAAVFLVLGGLELKQQRQRLYDADVSEVRRRLADEASEPEERGREERNRSGFIKERKVQPRNTLQTRKPNRRLSSR